MQPPAAPSAAALDAVLARHAIVLFDGVCTLCNHSVDFVVRHDPARHFKLASLQSEVGQALLARYGLAHDTPDSIVLIEDGRAYVRSTAALKIAAKLDGALPLLQAFLAIPPALRDAVYDYVARNRYRWFGKRETCRLPTLEERARFLG
jgi:predicted DCC family thiol-disulfide oxidoreductase YuxK